jgi:hypothetical protein
MMKMVNKLKIFAIFAVMGFILGVVIHVMYFEVLPTLLAVFPQVFNITWVVWGIVGASISVAGCIVYATLPQR